VETSVYGFLGEIRVLSGAGNWLMIIRVTLIRTNLAIDPYAFSNNADNSTFNITLIIISQFPAPERTRISPRNP